MPAAIHSNISQDIDIRVQFQWDGSAWTDETTNLMSASGALETVAPNEAYQSGKQVIQQMTIVLANPAQRYSFYNATSPLYTYLNNAASYYRRCKVEVQIGFGAWVPIFTGFIKIPREQYHRGQITFTAWDAGEFLRQRKSTPIQLNKLEHELVIYYLQLAGMVDGVDFISPAYAAANAVTATIAYSTTVTPHSWLDDEPVWDELVDVAQASGARIYIHQDGKVYFEKAWRWAMGYTPVLVLGIDDFAELSPYYDDKAFYDEVIVGYSPRVPGIPSSEVWKLQQNKLILPGKTEMIEARLRNPTLSIDAPVLNRDYYLRGLDGGDLSAQCTVVLNTYAQQAKITVTNSAAAPVVLGNFVLKGQSLVGQPSEQVKRTISAPLNGRRLEIRDNPYVQSELQARMIADTLRWWYSARKAILTVGGLRGDPSLRLGQKVTLTAPGGLSMNAIILRINQTVRAQKNKISYQQELTLLQDAFTPSTAYFMVGTDTMGLTRQLWV